MQRVLFVDDDKMLQEVVSQYFKKLEYEIFCTDSAAKAIEYLKSASIDCVILDVDLPDCNGFELCSAIRRFSSVPIIFLSCYSENDDRVQGFLSGGDDYVCKPFSLKELELRVSVRIMRRYANQPPEILQFGELTIDTGKLTASCNGKEYTFPRLEFDILIFFAHHPNQLFTYEQLYDNIWKQPLNESRHNLQARIGKVRKKLCEICPEKEYIRTVRHKGYLFVP